jgi:hypothetical protein
MKKSLMIFMLLTIGIFVLSACSSTTQSTPASSGFQQGQRSGTPPAASATNTPEAATSTIEAAAATVTDTPEPTLTSTPAAIELTVISAMPCLTGPAESYGLAGYLKTGESLSAFGRNSDNTYFYIENPRQTGKYCLIWGNYVLINGMSSSLPVVTNP